VLKGLRVSTTPFQDIINEIWIGFNPNQILKRNMNIEDIAEVLYDDEKVINKIKEVMKYNYSFFADGQAEGRKSPSGRSIGLKLPIYRTVFNKDGEKVGKVKSIRRQSYLGLNVPKEGGGNIRIEMMKVPTGDKKREMLRSLGSKSDFVQKYRQLLEDEWNDELRKLSSISSEKQTELRQAQNEKDTAKVNKLKKEIEDLGKELGKKPFLNVTDKQLGLVYEITMRNLKRSNRMVVSYTELMDRLILNDRRYKESLAEARRKTKDRGPAGPKGFIVDNKARKDYLNDIPNDMIVLLENEGKVREAHQSITQILEKAKREATGETKKLAESALETLYIAFENYLTLGKDYDLKLQGGKKDKLGPRKPVDDLSGSVGDRRFKSGSKRKDALKKTYVSMVEKMAEGLRQISKGSEEKGLKVALSKTPGAKLQLFREIQKDKNSALEFAINKSNRLYPVPTYTVGDDLSSLKESAKNIYDILSQKPSLMSTLELYAEAEYGITSAIKTGRTKKEDKAKFDKLLNEMRTKNRKRIRGYKQFADMAEAKGAAEAADVLIDLTSLKKFLTDEKRDKKYSLFIQDTNVDKILKQLSDRINRVLSDALDENFSKENIKNFDKLLDGKEAEINRKLENLKSQEKDLPKLLKSDDRVKELIKQLVDKEDEILRRRNARLDKLLNRIENVISAARKVGSDSSIDSSAALNSINDLENMLETLFEGANKEMKKEQNPLHQVLENLVNGLSFKVEYDVDFDDIKALKMRTLIQNTLKNMDSLKKFFKGD
jgi:hypothetical protein